MKIEFTESQNQFRSEIRDWFSKNVPSKPLASFDTKEGFEEHREWEKTLNQGNWSMVTWPTEYGGRALNLIEWLIFEEEYYRANAPARVNQNGVFLLGPTLMEYGTDDQKSKFLSASTIIQFPFGCVSIHFGFNPSNLVDKPAAVIIRFFIIFPFSYKLIYQNL